MGRSSAGRSALAATLIALAAAACARSNDPHDGGFVNGVVGLTSGAYQERLDQRQQQVDSLEQARRDMEQRLSATEQERAARQADAERLQQTVAALEQQSELAGERLMTAQRRDLAEREKLAKLLREQQAIESEIIALVKRSRSSPGAATVAASNGPSPGVAGDPLAVQQERQQADELSHRQQQLDSAISDIFGSKQTAK
jgi:hypothetical protein